MTSRDTESQQDCMSRWVISPKAQPASRRFQCVPSGGHAVAFLRGLAVIRRVFAFLRIHKL